jgi:mRNA-degrading endonuclease RelE of RelBE toxin-antitoxin system
MTYELIFKSEALDEWKKLDNSIKLQLKKVLFKRLELLLGVEIKILFMKML